jgi:hypothetical protein
MTWSASAVFNQALLNPIARGAAATTGFPTGYSATGLIGDTVKFALFADNTKTPNQKDTLANSAYNAGQWPTGSESSATGYTAGGSAVPATKVWSIDSTTGSLCFQAGATTLAWTISAGTLNAYGGLCYDSSITAGTVANQAICFNYFGGLQTLTGSGTFTVQWATVGTLTNLVIFNITV